MEVAGRDCFKMPAHERLFCLLLDVGGDEAVGPAELVDCVDPELKDYASSVMFGAKRGRQKMMHWRTHLEHGNSFR